MPGLRSPATRRPSAPWDGELGRRSHADERGGCGGRRGACVGEWRSPGAGERLPRHHQRRRNGVAVRSRVDSACHRREGGSGDVLAPSVEPRFAEQAVAESTARASRRCRSELAELSAPAGHLLDPARAATLGDRCRVLGRRVLGRPCTSDFASTMQVQPSSQDDGTSLPCVAVRMQPCWQVHSFFTATRSPDWKRASASTVC